MARRTRASSWATAGLQVRLRSVYSLPDTRMRKTPPGSFGVWYWIPQFTPRVLLSMNQCQIVVMEGEHDEGCLIQPCCLDKDLLKTSKCIPLSL